MLDGGDGNDTINGTAGDNIIGGVSQLGTDNGRGTIDILTGGAGADLFVFADANRGTFYNDGNSSSQGTGDYLLIKDFNSNEDKLQLKNGSQYLYRNVSSTGSSPGYTEIFLGDGNRKFTAADESIARLENVNLAPGTGVSIMGSLSWTRSCSTPRRGRCCSRCTRGFRPRARRESCSAGMDRRSTAGRRR